MSARLLAHKMSLVAASCLWRSFFYGCTRS